MTTKVLLLTVFLITLKIFSQPAQIWLSSYNSPALGSNDDVSGIAIDTAANVYIAGTTNGFETGDDIILVKFSSESGEALWNVRYSGPGNNEDKALAMTSDKHFIYITGCTFQSSKDIITLKYDIDGTFQWAKTYNGSGSGGDYGFAIKADTYGNVYVTGRSDTGGLQRFITIKYDSEGVRLWAAVYNGPLAKSFDQAQSLALDDNGNVYVTGFTSVNQDFSTADYLTIKYDKNGNLQWAKAYNGTGNSEDIPRAIVVSSGNVYVTGSSDSSNGNFDYFTIMYSSNGDSLAAAFYGGVLLAQIDNAVDMCADKHGNIYVTGTSRGQLNNFDYATIKYSSNLQQQWAARYMGRGEDQACRIVSSSSGGVCVTGTSVEPGSFGKDLLTVNYDSRGMQLWEMRYDSPSRADNICAGVVMDDAENTFIAGRSERSQKGGDIIVIKYSFQRGGGDMTVSGSKPNTFKLYQNYPNPFNPSTNIAFDIPNETIENTQLIIYDVLGRQVELLINQRMNAGTYSVHWDASKYSSGVYFYKLVSGSHVMTNKMILLE